MMRAGPVRSAVPPHGRHAITSGTNLPGGRGRIFTAEPTRIRRDEINQNDVLPGPKIDVRQGIARTRGHVAPARPLC